MADYLFGRHFMANPTVKCPDLHNRSTGQAHGVARPDAKRSPENRAAGQLPEHVLLDVGATMGPIPGAVGKTAMHPSSTRNVRVRPEKGRDQYRNVAHEYILRVQRQGGSYLLMRPCIYSFAER